MKKEGERHKKREEERERKEQGGRKERNMSQFVSRNLLPWCLCKNRVTTRTGNSRGWTGLGGGVEWEVQPRPFVY